jgi:esterase/lipase superfamily enzyme
MPEPAVDYVLTIRNISNGAFGEGIGSINYLRVPRGVDVPTPDMAVRSVRDQRKWIAEVSALADANPNPQSISECGDVLVFIHGFNNSLQESLQRQRLIAANLKAENWSGVVVGFDWPAHNSVLAYLEDRWQASKVAIDLVQNCIRRLSEGQDSGCKTNVHLLGHSTGAYVIMDAFANAEKDGDLHASPWRVAQVAFIAGDVATSSLSRDSDWSAPMFGRILRLTNYSNPYDAVLAASNAKRLGVEPRAGRVGLPPDANAKAFNVNCGEYFKTIDPHAGPSELTFTHSWYFGDRVFARDLAMTLEGAIDRSAITTRTFVDGNAILTDRPRPAHMMAWNIKASVNSPTPPRAH